MKVSKLGLMFVSFLWLWIAFCVFGGTKWILGGAIVVLSIVLTRLMYSLGREMEKRP